MCECEEGEEEEEREEEEFDTLVLFFVSGDGEEEETRFACDNSLAEEVDVFKVVLEMDGDVAVNDAESEEIKEGRGGGSLCGGCNCNEGLLEEGDGLSELSANDCLS